MLRGRLAKRDVSICALCQYRISLRRPGPSQNRLISATSQCASNHDPSHSRPFRPFPSFPSVPGAGTSSNTPASPQTQSLSTTTNPLSSYRTATPPQPSTNDAGTSTPSRGPVGGLKFSFGIRRGGDILDPHEAMARERLLAQKERSAPQPRQSQHGSIDPLVKARYVWDSPRQQAIERYLRAESAEMHGDVGGLKRRPLATRPALSLSGSDIGSNFSIRSEPSTKSFADRASDRGLNFFRRVAHHVDPPIRKVPASPVPARPVPQNIDPPPLSSQQPAIGQNSNSRDFVASSLSSLTGSGAFWHPNADNVRTTTPGSSKTTENKRPGTESSFAGFGKSAIDSTKAVAPSGGFDALETAGARDAEIKASTKSGSRGIGMAQEWFQLARKPVGKPSLDKSPWNTGQSTVVKFQQKRADFQDMERLSPDPWAITKNDTAFDNSISTNPGNPASQASASQASASQASPSQASASQASPRYDDYDREKNKRRDLFERDQRPGKTRGGKRSQKASRFDDDDGEVAYDRYQEKRREKELRKAQREAERTEPIPIILPELISITAFANALKIKPEDFLVQLGELGFEEVTLDSLMAGETAALVAQEYGYEPTVDTGGSQDLKPRPPPEDPSVLPLRPPVVTIMGHVDHGKTTILDYLRQSSVAAQEHGGITQHIGAFSVKLSSGKPITFLDTPGHAAFLTMRQRGANVTDIVVLVVAADDSVKPQTLEALRHARAAKVPIIVAINKIDKDGARIDAVKHDLAKAGLEIEDFGGDVQVVCVSGKTGQGMDDLEENILTLSEILDHRAEPDGAAEGWILESSLKVTGKVATVLVKRGTLRPGDYIAAGLTWAKIRQLRNEAGVDIAEAPPGTPVEILGWKDLPAAGDQVIQSPDEDKAKTAVSYREGLREREKDAAEYEVITEARKVLQEKRAREKATSEGGTGNTGGTGVQEVLLEEENGMKMVNFVVKGDVHGSVEAVCAAIQEIGSHEVRPRVLRSATGPISEFDVEHAATSKSVLVNFATTTPGHVQRMAEEQGVRILDHTIIYHLVDDVKANLSEYLTPDISTRVLGEAEVLQIFPINLRGRVYKNIAGCRVRNGAVGKNNLYRVMRRGAVVFDGKLETLKQVKKDVMEMRKGAECGIGFEEFQDLEIGDQIQAYEEVRTTRSL